ncbi:MAG: PD-(D/E)XK nuclease family protein [Thermofilum sp.]
MSRKRVNVKHTTWRDELEQLLCSLIAKHPGGVMSKSGSGAVFVDEVARVAKLVLDKLPVSREERERALINVIITLLNDLTIHELLHAEGLAEKEAIKAVNALLKWRVLEWVWNRIPCPKQGKEISFDECLQCLDYEKHEDCPLWIIRKTLEPRSLEAHTYHVTELTNPRKAYYSRLHSHVQGWADSALDYWFGKAAHAFIQQSFPASQREIFVWWNLGDVKIVGSIDAYDHIHRVLYEFKTYATIKFLLQRNAPEPEHVYQAQSYVKLAEMSIPSIRPEVIKIVYLAKSRLPRIMRNGRRTIMEENVEQRYKEFTLKPEPPEDLEKRARMLDEALEKRRPPTMKCSEWMCKECEYRKYCQEDGWK